MTPQERLTALLSSEKTRAFKAFCFKQHDEVCNQKYDGKLPYSFHLDIVGKQAIKYADILDLNLEDSHLVMRGAYGHDLIEDARVSYNDIKSATSYELAEIIYLCTENKGRNRAARKSKEFYEDLATNRLAVFVKLCDIISNARYSQLTVSSMFQKYASEWKNIRLYLSAYKDEFKPLFDDLDMLFFGETVKSNTN